MEEAKLTREGRVSRGASGSSRPATKENRNCYTCGNANHLARECKIDRTKTKCSHCKMTGSHMSPACRKKAKADKEMKTTKKKAHNPSRIRFPSLPMST